MTITTAQYKAAIEAKIAAANGSTTLKDLTLIKTNADLWLLNNSGGSITGYSTLEGLIQDKQDDLTGSSTLNDVSFVGVSAFPPTVGNSSGGFKNKQQITTSGTWTVPAGVFSIRVEATGGGGGGGGSLTGDGPQAGGGGAAGSTGVSIFEVSPGDILSVTIGSAGAGVLSASGTAGGRTTVRIESLVIAVGDGGNPGIKNAGGGISASGRSINGYGWLGGVGGQGAASPGTNGQSGTYALPLTVNSSSVTRSTGFDLTNGGVTGTITGGGGGGGASKFGVGGTGGAGRNSNLAGETGGSAVSTNYGAGGGGASGSNGSGGAAGGNGANGIVEIYY